MVAAGPWLQDHSLTQKKTISFIESCYAVIELVVLPKKKKKVGGLYTSMEVTKMNALHLISS